MYLPKELTCLPWLAQVDEDVVGLQVGQPARQPEGSARQHPRGQGRMGGGFRQQVLALCGRRAGMAGSVC